MNRITPLKSDPLNMRLYDILKEMIIYNQIEPGARLVIKNLCDKFQVSSSPVRDALRYLEADGLVINNGQSSFVLNLTKQDVEEIYEIRQVMEPFALEKAFPNFNIDKLEKLAAGMKTTTNSKASFANDMKFHNTIIESCNNTHLAKQLRVLANQSYHVGFRLHAQTTDHQSINNEHIIIINAICEQRKNDGMKLLKTHLENSMKRILNYL